MTIPVSTQDVPKNPAVRRAWVLYQLRVRGLSLRQLAFANKVSAQAVHNALMAPSSHLEPVIAKAIGLSEQQLFPERFDNAGNRLSQTRAQQRNTPTPARTIAGRSAS